MIISVLDHKVNLLKRQLMQGKNLRKANSSVEGTGHKIGRLDILISFIGAVHESKFREQCDQVVHAQVNI